MEIKEKKEKDPDIFALLTSLFMTSLRYDSVQPPLRIDKQVLPLTPYQLAQEMMPKSSSSLPRRVQQTNPIIQRSPLSPLIYLDERSMLDPLPSSSQLGPPSSLDNYTIIDKKACLFV